MSKQESWGYSVSVVKVAYLNFNRFWRIHPCDRRTDGRTTAYSALCIYAKNPLSCWDMSSIDRSRAMDANSVT